MDIAQILENAILGQDPQVRGAAEAQLKQAAKDHFVPYLQMLTEALGSQQQRTEVRVLAGIALKNELTAKDLRLKMQVAERWVNIEAAAKAQIKATAVETLKSSDDRVANAAAQLIAAIADIELPRSEWPDLTVELINNTSEGQPDHVKRASLLAIGYICEGADPSNTGVVAQADGILTAIVQGARKEEPNDIVRLTALNALVMSLEFIRLNFDKEGERNYIMQVVCEATQASNTEVQAAAFGALGRIMSLYYAYMQPYMEKALFGLTINGMQSSDDMVASMAVEFWSTVCEEEIDIQIQQEELGQDAAAAGRRHYMFAQHAIGQILPTLLTLLTRQEEDADDDDWSVAMAAGACLQLFAQDTGDAVVDLTLQFVSANITQSSWIQREAAVMAFGSILEGPSPARLKPLISEAMDPLLNLMSDTVLQVKDTAAWCLGRMADLVIEGIDVNNHLPRMIDALLKGLQDHPKVSTNCCWCIMNLAEQLSEDGPRSETTPMSQYYVHLLPALLQTASRPDNENSCRTSAYEALAILVLFSASDVLYIVMELSKEVLSRLESTVAMTTQIVSTDDRQNLEELQINLLGLLTNIIRRVDADVAPAAKSLLELFLRLLQTKLPNSLVEEDIFIAVGATAGAVGEQFAQYVEPFIPYIMKALQDSEYQTCNTAVGLVADICHAIGQAVEPYTEKFMEVFVAILGNDDVRREVKPVILSCIGDVASSIGPGFERYLPVVMRVLEQASSLRVDQDASLETLDFVYSLRESILDAYVGIIAGLREAPQSLQTYIPRIFLFLQEVSRDPEMYKSEGVVRSIVGLIGDVASMYTQGAVAQFYREDWITDIISRARKNKEFSSSTKETARWAREQQKLQQSLSLSA